MSRRIHRFVKPAIFYEVYGDSRALDLFALPHNAVRRLLSDLYDFLHAARLLGSALVPPDLTRLTSWWNIFRAFLFALFELEEMVLFPWITAVDPVSVDGFTATQRLEMKNQIVAGVLAVDKARTESLIRGDPLKLIDFVVAMSTHVDAFVPSLLTYFNYEERHLPPIIIRHYTDRDIEKLERRQLEYIKKSSQYTDPKETFALLSLWMTDEHRRTWAESTMKGLVGPAPGSRTAAVYLKWYFDTELRLERLMGDLMAKSGTVLKPPPPVPCLKAERGAGGRPAGGMWWRASGGSFESRESNSPRKGKAGRRKASPSRKNSGGFAAEMMKIFKN